MYNTMHTLMLRAEETTTAHSTWWYHPFIHPFDQQISYMIVFDFVYLFVLCNMTVCYLQCLLERMKKSE